jgi:ribonucleoside-diphosphate reductase alpha chain
VVDYVFRVLGIEYINRTDLAHIVTEEMKGAPATPSMHATGHPVGKEHRKPNGENGHSTPAQVGAPAAAGSPPWAKPAESYGDSGQDAMLSKFPGDAPACDQCGHITLRNGTCYKCLNCGNSMGCS